MQATRYPEKTIHRFWAKVDKTDGCWHWTASLTGPGYGQFWDAGAYRRVDAHRFSYAFHVGPVPPGLVLDHLCRNRACVNPEHLEPVTHRENILRGSGFAAQNAIKTRCVHGHPLSGDNLYVTPLGRRNCRTCRYEATGRSQARASVANLSQPKP